LSLLIICPDDAEARRRPTGHPGPLNVTIDGPSDLGHLDTYFTLDQWFCNYTARPTGGRPPYQYEWTASDGGSYLGQTARYYPTELGNQWVQVKVTDKNDETVTLKKDISVHRRLEISGESTAQEFPHDWFQLASWTNTNPSVSITIEVNESEDVEVTVGLTVTGGLNAGEIRSAIGAEFEGTRTTTVTISETTSFVLAPGDSVALFGRAGINVTTGDGTQWNTCSKRAEGSYENRHSEFDEKEFR
jgi:hypothetical protein